MNKLVEIILVAFIALNIFAPARAAVDRPPQFVVMAFDNCTELERWQELSDFVAEMNRNGDHLHFTFFVSGINFITDAKKDIYEGPRHKRGTSTINFGGSPEGVRKRIAYVNAMQQSGNEIASHAVGHFDGAGWSAAEWISEFRIYRDIFENVARNNGFPSDVKFAFPYTEIVGFRAPYLARGAGLYPALSASHFRYDTSADGEAAAWPEKKDGLWRFNLVGLRLNGSGKKTLSMDYNFFVAQSRARDDPRRADEFRDQMLRTYLDYFKANYAGNRAPLHIGHHFFGYQGGVYHQALKTFARMVCTQPEVRCTTYAKLTDFMDALSPPTLEAYRNGDFPHAGEPSFNLAGVFAKETLATPAAVEVKKPRRRPRVPSRYFSRFPAQHRALAR